MILIAHRCGPGAFPEQSIASARHALSLGADMVEMDIQYTRDGIPVICHDPNAKRMFGVDRLVKEMTFAEFMALRQSSDPSYPSHSLENVFQTGISPVLFHCKITGDPLRDLAERIKAVAFEKKCVVGVKYAEDVPIFLEKGVKTLAFMPAYSQLESFLDSGVEYIRLWEDWASEEDVGRIHSAAKGAWIMAGKQTPEGVGRTSEENLRMWQRWGCDGVLINDIAWAKSVLGL